MLAEEMRKYYGTWARMGRKLQFSPQAYILWLKNGYIPFATQCRIEKASEGLFKADRNHGSPRDRDEF